jgi:hypothetical protein
LIAPGDELLLNQQTRDYLDQLRKLPQLESSIYLEEFNGENNPFGKGPWTGISFELKASNGLTIGTTEGDGYCTYDFWIDDEDNNYLYQHMFEKEILEWLPELFEDRFVAYISYYQGSSVASGMKDISVTKPDIARTYHPSGGCLFPFKAKRLVLTHRLKSWNGKHDGVTETLGYF